MSVKIELSETENEQYEVNGKVVFKDSNGNWIALLELSTQEQLAFNNYIKSKQKGN